MEEILYQLATIGNYETLWKKLDKFPLPTGAGCYESKTCFQVYSSILCISSSPPKNVIEILWRRFWPWQPTGTRRHENFGGQM